MNSKQNKDFKTEVLRLFPVMRNTKKVFVADLNDVLNEGDFIDSFRNQPSFTNLNFCEPNDSDTREDYVNCI